MRNILTDKNVLIFSGIGAGIGLSLALLSGANKAGTTLTFAVLGGLVGYSGGTKESFSGVSGRRTLAPQSPPVNN